MTEDPRSLKALELICSVDPERNQPNEVKTIRPADVATLDFNQVAMLLWQAPFPQGTVARQVKSFVNSGRSVVFFPPDEESDLEFDGVRWEAWAKVKQDKDSPESDTIGFWRKEADLLRNTRNGNALPLDQLKIYQYCSLTGTDRTLARMSKGQPLLTRKTTDAGAVYFCTTLPSGTHSSLAREGVVMFAMMHRAMDLGIGAIGKAKQIEAGSSIAGQTGDMEWLASNRKLLVENRPFCSGVYQKGDTFIALNRPEVESSMPLAREQFTSLFEGLDAHFVDDSIGSGRSLASEIWKVFVILMGIALLVEAVLCLPPKPEENAAATLNPIGQTAVGSR